MQPKKQPSALSAYPHWSSLINLSSTLLCHCKATLFPSLERLSRQTNPLTPSSILIHSPLSLQKQHSFPFSNGSLGKQTQHHHRPPP